jgi:pimeloyl-ACP methyl ester carboxylesterase
MSRQKSTGFLSKAALLMPVLLAGCSTADLKEKYLSYEAQYKNQNVYSESFIDRNGLKICVHRFGPQVSSLSPIIMTHGFPDSQHLYDVIAPLVAKNRVVYTFDFIGWGKSSKPNPTDYKYDFENLRLDLEAVIQSTGAEKVVLLSHDIGLMPNLDWALANPTRVDSLIILNSFYFNSDNIKVPEVIAEVSNRTTKGKVVEFLGSNSDTIFRGRFQDQTAKFFNNSSAQATYTPILTYEGFAMRPAFFSLNHVFQDEANKRKARIPELKDLNFPVHMIYGKSDPYLGPGGAKEFYEIFSHSTIDLIEDAGHFVSLDKPTEVSVAIQKYYQ